MGQLHSSGNARSMRDKACEGKAFSDDDLVHKDRTWQLRSRLHFLALPRNLLKPSTTEPASGARSPRSLKTSCTTGDIAGGPLAATFVPAPRASGASSNGVVRSEGVARRLLLPHSHTTGDCRAETMRGALLLGGGSVTPSLVSGNSTPMDTHSPSLVVRNTVLPLRAPQKLDAKNSRPADQQSANSPTSNNVTKSMENGTIRTVQCVAAPCPQTERTFDVRIQTILDETATFLAYEIDPSLMSAFLQRRAKRCKKKNIAIRQMAPVSSHDDVRRILRDVIRDPSSDDFRLFCVALRKTDEESYVLEFFETLAVMLQLASGVEEAPEDGRLFEGKLGFARCVPDVICACGCYCGKEPSNGKNGASEKCSRNGEREDFGAGEADEERVDVGLQYVDRETRIPKPFSDVAVLKRFQRRMSQLIVDKGVAEIRPAIPTCVHPSDHFVPVMSVRMRDACLCDRRMRRMERALVGGTCVRALSLHRARFDVPAMVRLGNAVERVKGLHELDLRGCFLGNDGAMYVAGALRSNVALRVLNLSENDIVARGAAFIARSLHRSRTISELDLSRNAIGDGGAASLAAVIASPGCSLRRLRLRGCSVSDEGFVAFFEALRRNFKLSYVDVSENSLGESSAEALADVLVVNRSLREIIADACGVTARACAALARPLRANNALRRLALNDNLGLGDAGLALLAEGLKYNRAMEELGCNACNVGNAGLVRLLDVLRCNGAMRVVRLCDNRIVCNRPRYDLSPTGTAAAAQGCNVTIADCHFADVAATSRSHADVIITEQSYGDDTLSTTIQSDVEMLEDRFGYNSMTVRSHRSDVTTPDCRYGDVISLKHRRLESVSPSRRSRRDIIINGYHGAAAFSRGTSRSPVGVACLLDDVIANDVNADNVVYDRLVEVSQSSPQLRIFLLGNRLDEPSRLVLSAFYSRN